MSDLFISYARGDEAQAARVADALRACGYDVWRDSELPAHRGYAEVIEERLEAAKAVVVLWSSEAARSQWVRAEADTARGQGKLVQVSLDGLLPPIPFNQIQCAVLDGWAGDDSNPGWRKLTASVAVLAGPGTARGTTAQPVRPRSICVLPFQNMSGDPEQEYFSDGISEDITTDLSKVSALSVTARNTAFTLKGKAVDVCDVARKLGVSHVLEGSVRKSGNRLRITAQLIDGASGDHVWAERYDRDLTDIFAVQDQISEAIVGALKLKLLPREKEAIAHRGTDSVEAYNLYLMARNCWIAEGFADLRRAERVIRICRQVVGIAPGYAQAWALMGLAQAHIFYCIGSTESDEDGSEAAERALAIDPDIAEARLPRAWRFSAAGRYAEVNAELAEAFRLSPDSWEVHKEAARLYFREGRMDDVRARLERAIELMESDFHAWGILMTNRSAFGDAEGARRCAAKVVELVGPILARDPENGVALGVGASSLAVLGQPEQARQWIDRALQFDPDNLFMRFSVAWGLVAILKDDEAAIDVLQPLLERAGPSTIRLVSADPSLVRLREHPRFAPMLAAACNRTALAGT